MGNEFVGGRAESAMESGSPGQVVLSCRYVRQG
jgi:hypothetical protein